MVGCESQHVSCPEIKNKFPINKIDDKICWGGFGRVISSYLIMEVATSSICFQQDLGGYEAILTWLVFFQPQPEKNESK